MTDLTTTWATHWTSFTNGITWEIIMMDITFRCIITDTINYLFIT